MKPKILCLISNFFLAAIIFIFNVSWVCVGQNCTPNIGANANNYPKPYMWFQSKPDLIKNFKDNKYQYLATTAKSQPQSYVLKNFGGMIDYFCKRYKDSFECLRIVIAQFSHDNSSMVPKGWRDSMMLIFVPATSYDSPKKQDLGYYFFPADEPFAEANIADFKIDIDKYANLPGEWITNYQTNLLGKLDPTLDRNSNDDDDGSGKRTDTKWITYCAESFTELRREQLYTHTKNNIPVTLSSDILASFAAFDQNGNVNSYNHYKKRIFVQFDLINTATNQPFALEASDGFLNRSKPNGQCGNCTQKDNKRAYESGLDNGQLCPTYCQ